METIKNVYSKPLKVTKRCLKWTFVKGQVKSNPLNIVFWYVVFIKHGPIVKNHLKIFLKIFIFKDTFCCNFIYNI